MCCWRYEWTLYENTRYIKTLSVWPHRKRAAAAGSDLCPRRAAIFARCGKAFELYYVRLHHPRQTEGGLMSAASARRLFAGDDAVLRNTVWRPSRRGHRSLPAAAARFLCGQTLNVTSMLLLGRRLCGLERHGFRFWSVALLSLTVRYQFPPLPGDICACVWVAVIVTSFCIPRDAYKL